MVFFQFSPFSIQWSTASLIEFAATAFVLGAIVVIDSYSRNNSWALLCIATVLLTLGFMVKVTSAFAWALVFLVAALNLSRRSVPTWKPLMSGLVPLAIAMGATLAWTRWADSIKEQNPFSNYLTSSALREWNFGTLGQRLNIDQWNVIVERLPSLGAGLWVAVVLLIISLWRYKLDVHVVALASVPLIAFFVFFNLYYVHSYYLIAILPAYVALIGVGLTSIYEYLPNGIPAKVAIIAISIAMLILSWTSSEGSMLRTAITHRENVPDISEQIKKLVPPNSGVIIVGCDWNPTPLFYSNHRGLSLPDWVDDEIPRNWIGGDLTYLAFCGANFSLSDGDPRAVLPAGTSFEKVTPGIYRIS